MENGIKPLLNYDEQITKLKELGIKFNIKNEKEAIHILREHNYFFKIAYFRKNFVKTHDKGYNCEFHTLSEIATIDMRFRYLLLQMCLDIEHSIKCLLLDSIVNDPLEDGYKIMKDFFASTWGNLERVFENVKYKDRTSGDYVIKDKFKNYYDNPPVWVCLEIMTYSQLSAFVEFYYDRTLDDRFELIDQSMRLIKNVRNKCAHSEPLIVKLRAGNKNAPEIIQNGLSNCSISPRQFYVKAIIDLSALFLSHKVYCSDGIVDSRYQSLLEIKERYKKSINHFKGSSSLMKFFNALDKLIDNHQKSSLI